MIILGILGILFLSGLIVAVIAFLKPNSFKGKRFKVLLGGLFTSFLSFSIANALFDQEDTGYSNIISINGGFKMSDEQALTIIFGKDITDPEKHYSISMTCPFLKNMELNKLVKVVDTDGFPNMKMSTMGYLSSPKFSNYATLKIEKQDNNFLFTVSGSGVNVVDLSVKEFGKHQFILTNEQMNELFAICN